MKIRPVVVWFREPVQVDRADPVGKTKLEFNTRVTNGPDTKAAAEELLRSAQHPEDKIEGPMADMFQGIGPIIAQLQAQMREAPTPGVRRLPGWVEFTTAAGEILLVPQEQVAWIELGAETARA